MYDVSMDNMERARWKRTVARAYRLAAELRGLDAEVRFPANFEVHPAYRTGRSSAIVEVSPAVADGNQASAPTGPREER